MKRINEIRLRALDPEALERFYIDVLGMNRRPDGTIELIAATPGGHPWYTHPDCANIADLLEEAAGAEGDAVTQ